MYVTTRSGARETVDIQKITDRLKNLCQGLDERFVDPDALTEKVASGIYDGVTTEQLDALSSTTAAMLVSHHPHYGILAARIELDNLYRKTSPSFSGCAHQLYHHIHKGEHAPLLSYECYRFIEKFANVLDKAIMSENDEWYDYFAFKTLERSYLLKTNGQIAERPQYMLMRVACGLWYKDDGDGIDDLLKTYRLMSNKLYGHATPTLFNSGTPKPGCSSCFLLGIGDDGDSVKGIYKTITDCALISQSAGGKNCPLLMWPQTNEILDLQALVSVSVRCVPPEHTSEAQVAAQTASFPWQRCSRQQQSTSIKEAAVARDRLHCI